MAKKEREYSGRALMAASRYQDYLPTIPQADQDRVAARVDELIADNQSLTCFLKPGDKPEAVFQTSAEKVTAREFCNLHGHWKSEN